MIKAVVFDFDGVLANSEPLHFRAYRDVLAAHGLTLTESAYYTRYLGFDDVGAFRAIAGDAGVTLTPMQIAELVAQKAARFEAIEGESSVLFPGARDAVVRFAARGPVAIASGAIRAEIVRVLEHEALREYFPVLVAAEDTPASKPDPAPYRRAVELLATAAPGGLAPGECVAIEDSVWGLQSARDAGLHAIGVTHTYPADRLTDAELVVSHLDQLTWDLLQRLAD